MTKIRFSKTEVIHLLSSWIAISIAFGIALKGVKNFSVLAVGIGLSALTVGVGFIFHELSHKFLAQKYHCIAEFRADFRMLLIAIAISFTGFIFAAPGAVIIQGRINKEQSGKISLSGPAANLAIAILFLALGFFVPNLKTLGDFGFAVNSWLAFFNLLPLPIFDGKKVYDWNKAIYFIFLIFSAVSIFLYYSLKI